MFFTSNMYLLLIKYIEYGIELGGKNIKLLCSGNKYSTNIYQKITANQLISINRVLLQDISCIGRIAIKYLDIKTLCWCMKKKYLPDNNILQYLLDLENIIIPENENTVKHYIKSYSKIVTKLEKIIKEYNWINNINLSCKIFSANSYIIDYKIMLATSLAEAISVSDEQIMMLYDKRIFVKLKTKTYDYTSNSEIFYYKLYNAMLNDSQILNSKYNFENLFGGSKKIAEREKVRRLHRISVIDFPINYMDLYSTNLLYIRKPGKSVPTSYCLYKEKIVIGYQRKDKMIDLQKINVAFDIDDHYDAIANAGDIYDIQRLFENIDYNLIQYMLSIDDNMAEHIDMLISDCSEQIIPSAKLYYYLYILYKSTTHENDALINIFQIVNSFDSINYSDEDINIIGNISITYGDINLFNECFAAGYCPKWKIWKKLYKLKSFYSAIHYGKSTVSNYFDIINSLQFNDPHLVTIDEIIELNKKHIKAEDYYLYSTFPKKHKHKVSNKRKQKPGILQPVLDNMFLMNILKMIGHSLTEDDIMKLYKNSLFVDLMVENSYDFSNIREELYFVNKENNLCITWSQAELRRRCLEENYSNIKNFINRHKLNLDQYCVNNLYANKRIHTYLRKNKIILPSPSEEFMFKYNNIILSDEDYSYYNIQRDTYTSLSKEISTCLF